MKRAFLSAMPLALLLLPLLARTSLRLPFEINPNSGSASTVATVHAAESEAISKVQSRIRAAKNLLTSESTQSSIDVRLAAEDPASGRVHLLTVPKEVFLKKDEQITLTTSLGNSIHLRVVRPNGVNTAVAITDEAGRALQPLVVQYPIERGGKITELAYYTSAHPALESPEMAREGRRYIRRKLHQAATRLDEKGIKISPELIDMAERLCIVEHTDHKRFLTENSEKLFTEIATLYALNLGDTYRYSVSSAGAGGMIQMIPLTYKGIRDQHPKATLKPDFVEGMRDHDNAAEVMLLYMQDTWDNLMDEEEVTKALNTGIATQPELLAAGYNSNPRRLAGYLNRGGEAWRDLIPKETQMYLKIYAAVDRLTPVAG